MQGKEFAVAYVDSDNFIFWRSNANRIKIIDSSCGFGFPALRELEVKWVFWIGISCPSLFQCGWLVSMKVLTRFHSIGGDIGFVISEQYESSVCCEQYQDYEIYK